MRLFEIRMLHSNFEEVNSAIHLAYASVPPQFHGDPKFGYIGISLNSLNMELSLEYLEELSVQCEHQFPKTFWQAMADAAQTIGLKDDAEYYRGWM